jgi:hypothetical protein
MFLKGSVVCGQRSSILFTALSGEHELAPFKNAWIREFRDKRGLSVHDFSAQLEDRLQLLRPHLPVHI